MPSLPPHRPQPLGGADPRYGARASQAAPNRADLLSSDADQQQPSVAEFFAEALDSAMALVRADGGEIAILDEVRQVLVLRARRTQPRLAETGNLNTLGGYGATARHSQPHASRPSQPLPPPGAPSASYGRMTLPGSIDGNNAALGVPSHSGTHAAPAMGDLSDEVSSADRIALQSTQLLPAAMHSRAYRRGERLIGLCWERGEALVLRNDECRAIPGGSAPPDPDAPWHLAVPIHRPGSLALRTGYQLEPDVVGVISVYNRDPLWSFSGRDIELLTLHADRVARAMRVADLVRQNQSQADLLSVLGVEVSGSSEQNLYTRLREVVRRSIDAPSLAVLLYHPRHDVVAFEFAERDYETTAVDFQAAASLPPWWAAMRAGQSVRISAPEEHAQHPEMCVLGWGNDTPVQSLLAVPLLFHNTLLGAIVAGSPRADVYAPEHERLFTTIAGSVAILMQNALLADETRQFLHKTHAKERQLSILNNAVLTLNASLDLDETVRVLERQAAHLTEAKTCQVLLLDADDEALVARRSPSPHDAPDATHTEMRIPLDWRGLRTAVHSGQFMLMDNLDGDWNDASSVGAVLRSQQIKSCLVLPLAHQERALGILLVYTPGQRHIFPSEEIGLLQGLASQAAAAISNATLYAELQRAYEQQKELDRLKDEFILTVSHEFRTPVTAIEGYMTLISRHGQKLPQEKLDQFSSEIRQATGQLIGMIDVLRDASSMGERPLQLNMRSVQVRAAAEKALATQPPEDRARIQLEIGDDVWVLADGDRLPHVFSNLVSNAIKYSPATLPCVLTARLETRETLAQQGRAHAAAAHAAERWVVVGVRDSGEGIAPEDQAKLFQKFVRLSRSLTTSVRGTGLGLWICRQYLDAMGGDIWVESEYGRGAHFQFSLPVAPASTTMEPS